MRARASARVSGPGTRFGPLKKPHAAERAPAVTSGRVAALAVHPKDRGRYYVAAASGGVWKTVNAGITWTPVFDNEGSYSIGAIAAWRSVYVAFLVYLLTPLFFLVPPAGRGAAPPSAGWAAR